nr:PAN2-PAN3 deadenylation complex catalytic subunit PAN2 [Vanessa tameamea]
MEFHYTDLGMQSEHIMEDQFQTKYSQPYILRNQEAEYEVRSTVLVDGGDRYGVSASVFDKYEELVWMGNQGGHVTSYYGPNLQKYTSFQIHQTEEVRDILTLEKGIYCLTKTSLRHQIRRGIPQHTHKSSNMMDMQCLFQVNSHKFLIGGHQDKLLELDINKMTETVIKVPADGCAVLRSGGGSLVACGSANGMVSLRDIRNPGKAEHTFRAHSACLSDLDMQGNHLITCGFTQSATVAVPEPYVLVWDVRRVKGKAAWSIPTVSPPLLLHFVPAVSGRAVALAGDGHVTLFHVNEAHESEYQSVFQVNTQTSQCSVMDVSSTSQALVFGDQSGHLHLFSAQHNHEPHFNNFSRATEFADPAPELPVVGFNDTTFQFSTVPLSPLASGSRWFNELPPDFFKKIYRKPKPIDPEVLKTMKMQGPIGYAPNPKTHRRNEMPYVEDNLDNVKKNDASISIQPIPRHYLKIEIRFNKLLPSDEDIIVNKTGFPGLESTMPNSYCNAMLQVLYYIPPLKATLLAHTCAKEFCLSCELGFLFRTLDTSGGAPCQASNFLRAFRTVPEAAALGLILPERAEPRADLVTLIQSWNRFILHQIHYEILETRKKEKELTFLAQKTSPPKPRVNNTRQMNGQYEYQYNNDLEFLGPSEYEDELDEEQWRNNHDEGTAVTNHVQNESNDLPNKRQADNEESEISQLFAIGRQQINKCMKCNKEEERVSAALACALAFACESRGGFAELVRASLCARRTTPAWCERCARFTPTAQHGRILRLPPILAINCGGVTAHEKAYWAKGIQKDVPEASKRAGISKPCRYGLHCARPGCRFKHPERSILAPQFHSLKSSTQESNCVLPHQLHIRLQSDGEVIINDKTDSSTDRLPDINKHKKKPVTMRSEQDYHLSAVVVCVEDNPKNLVSYVRIPDKKDEARWFLFNDLSIVQVSPDEVVQFSSWWKSPCVLFYTSSRVMLPSDTETS